MFEIIFYRDKHGESKIVEYLDLLGEQARKNVSNIKSIDITK